MAGFKQLRRTIHIGRGFAGYLHGYHSITPIIETYVDDTKQNRDRLGMALEEMKISTKTLIARMHFVPGWSIMHLQNGFPLDIMTQVKGLEHLSFDECYKLASTAQVENVSIKFLYFNHLLQPKRAANRPKDQIDIKALEEIRRIEQAEK